LAKNTMSGRTPNRSIANQLPAGEPADHRIGDEHTPCRWQISAHASR